MKIRKGFVSNSSSASFVVEVKGEKEKLFKVMYEEMEIFSTEACIERLEKSLIMLKKYKTPNKDSSIEYIKDFKWKIKKIEEKIKKFKNYEEPDWLKLKGIDKKEQDFLRWGHERHIQEVVEASLEALRWQISIVDKKFVSFRSGGCIIYNGWEDIRIHKELIELLGFFTFNGYEVETAIEEDI